MTDPVRDAVLAMSKTRECAALIARRWHPDELDAILAAMARAALTAQPSERYVDVHHLVEAELAIARLTKDSAGRPAPHNVTQVAKAVANAFDMDLTPDAEHAGRPVHRVRDEP